MSGGIFAVFDDIAMLLDDIAMMSKVSAKKTVGILGDDLAVNAEKASGFSASRELPVLWAITKGSFLNKLMILPLVFFLNFYFPFFIIPILIIGGIYLSFEGAEKIYDYIIKLKNKEIKKQKILKNFSVEDILKIEKDKIKSAIRTDFILSLEIVIIALSTVLNSSLIIQIIVVSLIALLATIGVYGIVAFIVRLDDFGYRLQKRSSFFIYSIGTYLIDAMPKIIRLLTIIGTIAMLSVGGSIFTHNIELLHHNYGFLADIILALGIGSMILVLEKTSHYIITKNKKN